MTKSKKPAKRVKPSQPKPNELVVLPRPNQSPIEISGFLDNLPLNACVELTQRILTSVPTHLSGAARLRAVLKTIVLFVAEYSNMAHADDTD